MAHQARADAAPLARCCLHAELAIAVVVGLIAGVHIGFVFGRLFDGTAGSQRNLHLDLTGTWHRVFLCSAMILRRTAGAILILLAVQYAAFGAAPLCADPLHAGSHVVQVPAHGEHHTGVPCAPTPQDSGSHHSAPGCLAMTGCVAAGIAAVAAPQLVDPRVRVEQVARAPAPLASIFFTPETPPPIA